MKKMRNEGQVVEQKEKLREAKKSLREFERNMDKELPKFTSIDEFRSLA